MTRGHLVLGSGNLAQDLCFSFESRGMAYEATGFDIVDCWRSDAFPNLNGYETVWLCTGGRHPEAKKNYHRSHRHNVDFPRMLMDRSDPDTGLVFFSSADCADPAYPDKPHHRNPNPRNEFAMQKLALEGSVISRDRPRTAVVRLSSLYGAHSPWSTFPGRLLMSDFPEEMYLSFPQNEVTPTPTHWAADRLIEAMDKNLWNISTPTLHHLSPIGSISSHDWAKLIFGDLKSKFAYLERKLWDDSRPRHTQLGTSIWLSGPLDYWHHLWEKHFEREAYQVIR